MAYGPCMARPGLSVLGFLVPGLQGAGRN